MYWFGHHRNQFLIGNLGRICPQRSLGMTWDQLTFTNFGMIWYQLHVGQLHQKLLETQRRPEAVIFCLLFLPPLEKPDIEVLPKYGAHGPWRRPRHIFEQKRDDRFAQIYSQVNLRKKAILITRRMNGIFSLSILRQMRRKRFLVLQSKNVLKVEIPLTFMISVVFPIRLNVLWFIIFYHPPPCYSWATWRTSR